ncbi:MAG: alternative ribosome rescue aminoacyl-tRNA hydrolase ArfB [Gemmatimonadaceae bacterium]
MSGGAALAINERLTIPRSELTFRASRAGGPGGQHVNTSSTRVELVWNVRRSAVLSEPMRRRLVDKLATRLDADGNVRIVASAFRSQSRNRMDAEDRLAVLVRRALVVPKVRKKTRPTRASVESRLRTKQKRGERKRLRTTRDFD